MRTNTEPHPDPYVEARRRQGLPDRVTDPQVIARIAALLRRPPKGEK